MNLKGETLCPAKKWLFNERAIEDIYNVHDYVEECRYVTIRHQCRFNCHSLSLISVSTFRHPQRPMLQNRPLTYPIRITRFVFEERRGHVSFAITCKKWQEQPTCLAIKILLDWGNLKYPETKEVCCIFFFLQRNFPNDNSGRPSDGDGPNCQRRYRLYYRLYRS